MPRAADIHSAIGKHLVIKRELKALAQGVPAPLRGPVKRLSDALRELDRLYLATGTKGASGPPAQLLKQTERRASELAVAAGLASCAPLPVAHA